MFYLILNLKVISFIRKEDSTKYEPTRKGKGMTRSRIQIFVLILCVLFIFLQPTVNSQSLQSITWHESIKKDAIIAWRITRVESTGDSDISFLLGMIIQIKYVENPPTDPARVFNTTKTPDWVNMYVNGFRLNLTMMGEGASAFTQLVLPIEYSYDNGTSFGLSEFYRIYAPFEELESYFHVEGDYLNSTFGNETTRLTMFTNINTGIAANVSLKMGVNSSIFIKYFRDGSNVNEEGETTDIGNEYTEFHDDPAAYFRNYILTIVGSVALTIILVVTVIFLWRRRGRQ